MNKAQLIEQLAAEAHTSWAHWMEHLFRVCSQAADGSVIIPADFVERWQRQASIPYSLLTEPEKQSDRNRVYAILSIIDEYDGMQRRYDELSAKFDASFNGDGASQSRIEDVEQAYLYYKLHPDIPFLRTVTPEELLGVKWCEICQKAHVSDE